MIGTVFMKDGSRKSGDIVPLPGGYFLVRGKRKHKKVEIPKENVSYIEYKNS